MDNANIERTVMKTCRGGRVICFGKKLSAELGLTNYDKVSITKTDRGTIEISPNKSGDNSGGGYEFF